MNEDENSQRHPVARTVPYICACDVELGHQERSTAITKNSNSLFCVVSGSCPPPDRRGYGLYAGQNSRAGGPRLQGLEGFEAQTMNM